MTNPRRLRAAVASYFQHVDAEDIDALVALFDEAVVYERPGYEPIRGREQLRRFYTDERVIASGRHDVERVLVEGDAACAWGSFSGVSRDGAELNERWCDVYQFVGAHISHRRTHFFRPAV